MSESSKQTILSSTFKVIPYAEFMFSYASWKKLTTPFLNQKWVFWPFSAKKGQKGQKNFQTEGRKKNFHKCLFTKITEKIFFIQFLDVSGQNTVKKNFQTAGRKKFFPSLEGKFPSRGWENFFSSRCLKFFYFSSLSLKISFWPFWPFWPFLAFISLWNIHSSWELPLKWKKVTSSMAKSMSPWIFCSPQTEVYPWAAFTPLGLNYCPRFARA